MCDDGDEDDDGALFPQKRRCQAPPSVYLLRNVPAASISLSHLKQTNKATTAELICQQHLMSLFLLLFWISSALYYTPILINVTLKGSLCILPANARIHVY